MKALNVIIAGECSGTIRDAFAALGHNAWSCDLKPSSSPGGQHYQGSWRDIHWPSFDLLIAHPVCTHLAVSGARHFAEKRADGRQRAAIAEFLFLANAPVAMKAIEQPVSIMSSLYRKPDQIIQPWQFGHGETKATCLWLTGLPKLIPTNIVDGREARIHRMPPSPGRAALRSVTYSGIAEAMALQWGGQVDREELAA
jgi:hypothetical protein